MKLNLLPEGKTRINGAKKRFYHRNHREETNLMLKDRDFNAEAAEDAKVAKKAKNNFIFLNESAA